MKRTGLVAENGLDQDAMIDPTEPDMQAIALVAQWCRKGRRQQSIFLEETLQRARGILGDRANWAAVEALARALLEMRTTSGAAAKRTIARAICEKL